MKPPFKHYRNLIRHRNLEAPTEPWFVKYWRAAAAWIYLLICVFDFVVMPLYVTQHNLTTDQIMDISSKLRPEDRLTAIIQLEKKNSWLPLTLAESGMFMESRSASNGPGAERDLPHLRGASSSKPARHAQPHHGVIEPATFLEPQLPQPVPTSSWTAH